MSDQPHSPEPWDDCGTHIEDANGRELVQLTWLQANDCYASTKAADARRITACVNFLRGVPTDELERILAKGLALRSLSPYAAELFCAGIEIEERDLR